jgi:serine/threonine protein kinase
LKHFLPDKFGAMLCNGSYGKVHKAIKIQTGKAVVIKSIDVESESIRSLVKKEEKRMKDMKGRSSCLIDLIESFEEVCYFFMPVQFFVLCLRFISFY